MTEGGRAPASSSGAPAVDGTIDIRPATAADGGALASLAVELGYAVAAGEIPRRLASLAEQDAVLVATEDGEVVGWIHLAVQRSLLVEPRATVEGLVVRETRRGRGIGRRLIECADAYARRLGLGSVVLRSNVRREAAHVFYRRLGFEERKRSVVFERAVSDGRKGPRPAVVPAGTSDGPTAARRHG